MIVSGYPGLEIIAKLATVLEVEPAELLRHPAGRTHSAPRQQDAPPHAEDCRLGWEETESDGRGQALSGLHSAGLPGGLGARRRGRVPCGACSACCYYDGIPVDEKRDRKRLAHLLTERSPDGELVLQRRSDGA